MTFSWDSSYTNQDLTRSDFITDLRILIDEDIADVISDTQLNSLIDLGLRDISRTTGLLKATATEAVSGNEYTLPTDMTKLDQVIYDDGTTKTFLTKSNPEGVTPEISSGVPNLYIRYGDKVTIYGTPTTGTMRIIGTKQPTLPAVNSDYIDLPQQYLEILIAWLQVKYWQRRRSAEDYTFALQYYANVLQDVRDDVSQEFEQGATMYG